MNSLEQNAGIDVYTSKKKARSTGITIEEFTEIPCSLQNRRNDKFDDAKQFFSADLTNAATDCTLDKTTCKLIQRCRFVHEDRFFYC